MIVVVVMIVVVAVVFSVTYKGSCIVSSSTDVVLPGSGKYVRVWSN